MKLLVAAEEFPALSETFVLNQIIGLRQLGFDVSVIADRKRQEKAMHRDVLTHGLLDAVSYADGPARRSAKLGNLIRLAAHTAARRDGGALRELGFSVYDTLRQGGMHGAPGRLTRFHDRLAGRLAGFDAVLCHFGPNGDLMTRVSRVMRVPVPVVTVFHGYDLSSYLNGRGDAVYRRLFARGALFLAACDMMRSRLIGMGAPPDRTLVQRMGVDAQRFAYAYQGGAEYGPFTFALVGRLVEKKGAGFALRALAAARTAVPARDLRLVLVGDGPLRTALTAEARALGIAAAVDFLGAVTHDRVAAQMRAADALVQPSITATNGDLEASPVVLQEAMALGVPVIATRHGGIPELVEEDATGLLVPERDHEALAAAMVRLATDGPLRHRISLAGRQRVERDFNLDRWNAVLAHRLRAVAGVAEEPERRSA